MPGILDIAQLRTLVAIADSGGFGRAATVLGVSQPTVSKHVRGLERVVGRPVVERTGRQTRFTSVGEVLLAEARQILLTHDNAIRRLDADRTPKLCFGVTENADQVLPEVLSALRCAFPQHDLVFRVDQSGPLAEAITRGALDVALVTGAASGIGRATAELFAERGFGVVAVDRDKAGLDELSEVDRERIAVLPGDVSTEETNAAAVEEALARFGRLDATVLNAGIGGTPPLEDPRAIPIGDRILAVNLRGPILGLRAALPALRAVSGSAVVVASVAGLRGDPGNWAYNTAKGGLVNLVRATALDYAAEGVRINAVAPGLTETGITAGVLVDPGLTAMVSRRIPLQRFVKPREQAEAIWFLTTPAASYITGTTLVVDGGLDASLGILPLPARVPPARPEH